MPTWSKRVIRERREYSDGERDTWLDECAELGRNACRLLRAAGKPVTEANVVRLIEESPTADTDLYSQEWHRQSLCVQCLLAVDNDSVPDREDLADYFLLRLPRLRPSARRLLEEAFRGVLEGLELELPFAEECDEPTGN